MKFIIVAVFALIVCVAARPQQTYTTKYDGIDLDEILKSDRLFNNYFKCLMEKGKCTPDGSELKKVLPDALQTNCHKCSEKQKTGTEKVIKFMTNQKPTEWSQLLAKYDPQGKYVNDFQVEAGNRGIKLQK